MNIMNFFFQLRSLSYERAVINDIPNIICKCKFAIMK